MIIDIRDIDDGIDLQSDICIVGAGPAGIVLALELESSNKKVVVIEAGDSNATAESQLAYDGTSTGLPYYPLSATRLRKLGGSTGHWSGWNSAFTPMDFELRDWIPYSGWPIDFDDIQPFYEKAQLYMQLGPFGYDMEAWVEEYKNQPGFDGKNIDVRLWQFSSPPLDYGKAYLSRLQSSENIVVYLNANAVSIDLNEGGEVVDSISLQTFGEGNRKVVAKHFVIASGGIENARLLLASRSVMPEGVGNQNDLVGRFFTEHIEVECGKITQFDTQQMKDMKRKSGVTRGEVGTVFLPSELQQRINKIANGAAFVAAPALNSDQDGWKSFIALRESLKSRAFSRDMFDHIRMIFRDFDTFAGVFALRLSGIPTSTKITGNGRINVISIAEQLPNPNSRVTLSDQADRFGYPKANLHWQLTERDKHTLRESIRILATEFRRLGLGLIRVDEWLMNPDPNVWDERLRGGHHHTGTTRMSSDEKRGVVDLNCSVFGVDNLSVSGCSVFPTASYSTPTLTIVALAIRLAEYLKIKING